MSSLDRNKIINELERYHDHETCEQYLISNAIDFIKEQDKEIKKLKTQLTAYEDLIESREQRIKELAYYRIIPEKY